MMESRVRPHRILMVEDDPEYARNVRLLVGPRFDVDTSEDAGSGLEKLQAERFEVLILDLDLPPALAGGGAHEGFALATRARRLYGDALPIVILTREVPEHLIAKLPEVADVILMKSTSVDVIVSNLLHLVMDGD